MTWRRSKAVTVPLSKEKSMLFRSKNCFPIISWFSTSCRFDKCNPYDGQFLSLRLRAEAQYCMGDVHFEWTLTTSALYTQVQSPSLRATTEVSLNFLHLSFFRNRWLTIKHSRFPSLCHQCFLRCHGFRTDKNVFPLWLRDTSCESVRTSESM